MGRQAEAARGVREDEAEPVEQPERDERWCDGHGECGWKRHAKRNGHRHVISRRNDLRIETKYRIHVLG